MICDLNKTYNGHDLYRDVTPVLNDNTVRLLYKDGVTPTFKLGTGVQISQQPNIWDLTYNHYLWMNVLINHNDLLSVLDSNLTSVNDTQGVFAYCNSLSSVNLNKTGNIYNFQNMFDHCYNLKYVNSFDMHTCAKSFAMFRDCRSLTTIPDFNTSALDNTQEMFAYCWNVTGGALNYYNKISTQTTPPTTFGNTFQQCGKDTQTGSAELAQIPQSWGGLALG